MQSNFVWLNKTFIAVEIGAIVIALIFAIMWVFNPGGIFEPVIVLCGLAGPMLEIVRRYLLRRIGTTEVGEIDKENSEIDIFPINEYGSNILGRQKSIGQYFLQVHFNSKTDTDAEILNVDVDYWNSRYLPIKKEILVDGEDIELDVFDRPTTPVVLKQGKTRRITLVKRFPIEQKVIDNGPVLISMDVSFNAQPSIIHKEWRYKLAGGGALEPNIA